MNYFPKRPSGAPLHTLSKLYDVTVGFVAPLLIWDSVLLYLRSPKGGFCSISDDLSCSCPVHLWDCLLEWYTFDIHIKIGKTNKPYVWKLWHWDQLCGQVSLLFLTARTSLFLRFDPNYASFRQCSVVCRGQEQYHHRARSAMGRRLQRGPRTKQLKVLRT